MENLIKSYLSLPIMVAVLCVVGLLIGYVLYLKIKDRHLYKRLLFMQSLSEYDALSYFAFYKNKTECSKQLALLMALEKGIDASFDDVLLCFNQVDATLITNAASEDNVVLDVKSKGNLWVRIKSRIFYDDNDDILARVLYFKNITDEKMMFDEISDFGKMKLSESHILQGVTDALPFPLFVRDDNLNIIYCNNLYVKDMSSISKQKTIACGIEPLDNEGVREARSLSATARKTKSMVKRLCRGVNENTIIEKTITEIPFLVGEKVYSIGFYNDEITNNNLSPMRISEVVFLKLLDLEGVGFAYFADDLTLSLTNATFLSMWQIDDDFVKRRPSYIAFLDYLYVKKNIPLSKTFDEFKKDDLEMISSKKMQVDQVLLPSGACINRIFVANIGDGVVVLYKDISEELLKKQHSDAGNINAEIINNLNEGVVIFGANKSLRIYNKAFMNMWKMDREFLDSLPLITEVFERKKAFFSEYGNWHKARESLFSVIDGETVVVEVSNNKAYEIVGTILPDGGLMINYSDVSESHSERLKNIEIKESLEVKEKLLNVFSFEAKNALAKNIMSLHEITGNKKLLQLIIANMARFRENMVRYIDLINIDSSMRTVAPDVVDVKNMLISVMEMVKEHIAEKKIELSANCPDDIDWITVDERLIKHMLLYIVDNMVSSVAIGGGVDIKVMKLRKKDISETLNSDGKDDFYLVIEFRVMGNVVNDNFDLSNPKKDAGTFGAGNRLIRKILKMFEGFFITDSSKKMLKICLPYHK